MLIEGLIYRKQKTFTCGTINWDYFAHFLTLKRDNSNSSFSIDE